jgi:hypothetical protein
VREAAEAIRRAVQIQQAAIEHAAVEHAERGTMGCPVPTHRLTVERWSDFAIGIDEDGSYLGISPCPEYGQVFPRQTAEKLHLPGKRWEHLLDLLARSKYGNEAEKLVVMERFGYLKAGEFSDEDLEEIRTGSGEVHKLKTACKTLTDAIGDLARDLREQVRVASPGEVKALSVANPRYVRAGFTVRYLKRDDKGKLRFGGD